MTAEGSRHGSGVRGTGCAPSCSAVGAAYCAGAAVRGAVVVAGRWCHLFDRLTDEKLADVVAEEVVAD